MHHDIHHERSDPGATVESVVLTGLTASAGCSPSAGDAAASAMAQIAHELARAGMAWADLRMLTVQIEADVPGVASWRLIGARSRH